jgi:adenosine deaminase
MPPSIQKVTEMRQIEIEDLYGVLISRLGYGLEGSPISSEHIESGLVLRADEPVVNAVVRNLIGTLSFRNREQIVRLIYRLTGWVDDERIRRLDLVRYWSDIASHHLEYREVYYIRADRYERWRRYLHSFDEDLPPLCNLVCNHSSEIRSSRELYKRLERWPTFLRGDEPQLYRDLQQGIGCLHLHLSGSYPAPYFWVALMNNRFSVPETLKLIAVPSWERGYLDQKWTEQIPSLVQHAQLIRWRLFELVQKWGVEGGSNDVPPLDANFSLVDGPETFLVDVDRLLKSVTNGTDYTQLLVAADGGLCPSLVGERWLNYCVLAAIKCHANEPAWAPLSRAYFSYIQAKNLFLNLAQQQEGTAGFDYFEHKFRVVRWDTEQQQERCAREIGNFLQESGAVLKLELMIAPKQSVEAYKKQINVIKVIKEVMDQRLSESLRLVHKTVKVGVIVHFIKDHGVPLKDREVKSGRAYLIYHHKRRDKNLEELETLVNYLDQGDGAAVGATVPVLAIDTANRELYCPPEVFGELYVKAATDLRRYTSHGRSKAIGKTYHVGEDFAYPMTGLRRVYEAITFLNLRSGDRIGHASALGIDVEQWLYTSPTVSLHLIDILDDAVFEWYLLQQHPDSSDLSVSARLATLQRTIELYSAQIYGEPLLPYVLQTAWLRRGTPCRRGSEKYSEEANVPLWVELQGGVLTGTPATRSDQPAPGAHGIVPNPHSLIQAGVELKLWTRAKFSQRVELPADTAERVLLEYLYDRRTISKFINLAQVDVSKEGPNVRRVQSILLRILTERGITIESNPTSNWLIGGFERHADVPAVQWQLHNPYTAVTINPDDPTVFSTSIENEYFFVFAALVHGSKSPLTRIEALSRTSNLRARGLDASFLD